MLPVVTIQGNVTADPDLKFTATGMAVCTITVAAGERKKDDAGNWVNGDTTFLNCTVWGDTAEMVADSITKGQAVAVVGKLKQRVVERDGSKTTYFDVKVDSIALEIKKAYRPAKAAPVAEPIDPWATQGSNGEAPF